MTTIFQNVKCGCYCLHKGQTLTACLCGPEERVIRGYIDGDITDPMTPEQREYCVAAADWAGEGYYNRKELESMNDRELSKAVLNAWHMYAQSQF